MLTKSTGIYALIFYLLGSPVFAGSVSILEIPEALPIFSLRDHNGAIFTEKQLENQWSFMVFGYTSCPDVCPSTLSTLSEATTLIRNDQYDDQHPVKTIFVSLDPVRDKNKNLKRYVQYFDKNFIAVTGKNSKDLNQLTKPIGVMYEYVDTATYKPINNIIELTENRKYTVNHFSGILIIDPYSRISAIAFPPHDAEQINNILRLIRQPVSMKE